MTLAAPARVAAEVARLAAGAAPAAALLDALRPVVPFVAAELAAWDPLAGRYRTLVNAGYPDPVIDHMNGTTFLGECDELDLRRTGAPARMRDVPRRARAASGTIQGVLLPAGYREGVTMHLRCADGRPAGMLNLSVDDARHPTDDACALLSALNAALAAACDPTRSLRRLVALVAPGAAAAAVTRAGEAIALAGETLPPEVLGGGPPVPGRRLVRDGGAWWARTVVPCREPALPEVCALVVARPRDDVRGLTRRELEVLALLARGLSNGEIAAALVVSRRTVSTHVERILGKLGVPTRAAAAALAVEDGLLIA